MWIVVPLQPPHPCHRQRILSFNSFACHIVAKEHSSIYPGFGSPLWDTWVMTIHRPKQDFFPNLPFIFGSPFCYGTCFLELRETRVLNSISWISQFILLYYVEFCINFTWLFNAKVAFGGYSGGRGCGGELHTIFPSICFSSNLNLVIDEWQEAQN